MSDKDTEERRERLGSSYKEDSKPVHVNRGYTRMVKTLRVLLPLIAVGVMIGLVLSAEREAPVIPIEKIETPKQLAERGNIPEIEKNELIKPEFESQTKDGKSYKIIAANATQELRQPDLIILDRPQGTLQGDPHPLEISARNGTYNQKTQFITLSEDIVISQETSGKILMKTLEADLDRGEIFSPHSVTAEGSYGSLDASAMRITDNGTKIIFEGPATLTITEGLETWLD